MFIAVINPVSVCYTPMHASSFTSVIFAILTNLALVGYFASYFVSDCTTGRLRSFCCISSHVLLKSSDLRLHDVFKIIGCISSSSQLHSTFLTSFCSLVFFSDDRVSMSVGRAIQQGRAGKGMTQKELATVSCPHTDSLRHIVGLGAGFSSHTHGIRGFSSDV